jgi:D-3-phosphoglycerate dehydrogenase
MGAVNFPEVQLPVRESGVRFLHIHGNVPGILRKLNEVFASRNLNMAAQYLQTDPEIGYVVFDVDGEVDDQEILADIRAIEGTVRARVLYDRRP